MGNSRSDGLLFVNKKARFCGEKPCVYPATETLSKFHIYIILCFTGICKTQLSAERTSENDEQQS